MMAPSTRFHSMPWVMGSRVSKVCPSRSHRSTWWPCSRSAFSMPLTTVAKNHRLKYGTMTATPRVRPDTRLVAAGEAT
jgi:hypothetical protein